MPDDDVRDIDNSAFGVTRANGMKEIVGYAMIEPDGSVMTRIPANTALMVSVLDERGKRITSRHNNWITAVPGEELQCNGCHVANSGLSRRIRQRLGRRGNGRCRLSGCGPAVVRRKHRRHDGGIAGARHLLQRRLLVPGALDGRGLS